ncbi:Mechanosensitive ion channel-domain-containing protein [Lyophyllum atratum]|nr:Mechanosensitive ion channel-domain-containing protein [Lyophyllum atratum]
MPADHSDTPPGTSPSRLDGPAASTASNLRVSSPPYRPVASTSDLHEEPLPSPAYYPPTNTTDMANEKTKASVSDELDTPTDGFDTTKSRPTVHYLDDLDPPAPGYTRTDSIDIDAVSSRASSIGTDDEESDNYDWSGEEDLVEEEAKFEERMGLNKTKRKGWGPKRITTLLFSTIIGSTFLAGVLVVPGVLVQLYWYKPHPTDYRRYVKDNVQAWLFWAAANLVISWYLALIVDVIPVVVQLIIAATWGHVSEHVKTRIEIYDSIKNNIKPLLYAASGWASWSIIFGLIYNLYNTQEPSESRARYTERLQEVVAFLFFFALMLCVKRMLSHTIAFSFHRTAYKDRIEEIEEALKVIETLRQYRPKPSPRARKSPGIPYTTLRKCELRRRRSVTRNTIAPCTAPSVPSTPVGANTTLRQYYDGEDGTDADNEEGITHFPIPQGKETDKKKDRLSWLRDDESGRATPELTDLPASEHEMMPLSAPSSAYFGDNNSVHRYPPGSPPRNGSNEGSATQTPLTSAAKVLRNAVLHDARNIRGKNIGDGSMAWNISSTHEAKRLARSIYTRFKNRQRTYLLASDFYPAFPNEAAAEAAFRVFDKDNDGDILRGEIKAEIVRVYKERRFLSRSMRDVGAALKMLDQILLLFAMVILFFISLSVFGVEVGSSLTSVYSLGIAASFIFKNSASSAFDAIMFLFVSHPYDTGDRCFIDEDVLVVKKVGLFATVFTRADGTESYYFNSQLFTKFITNVRRSDKTFENLTMQVAWRTPLETLDMLEKLMNEWLSTEEHRWFEPSTSVSLQTIEFQRYLTLTIGIGHNGNWQDWDLRWKRKTAFHAAVQYYCRQLDIVCFESTIPIVYADPETRQYMPPASSPPASPLIGDESQSPLNVGEDADAKALKPLLGFLPPLSTRSSHLSRARKSKSKKASVRGLDAG